MSAFTRWVDGEAAVPLHAEFKPIKEKKPNKKHKHASLGDRQRLDSFLDKTRRGKLIRGYGGIEKYYR